MTAPEIRSRVHAGTLADRYAEVREHTVALTKGLSDADMTPQSMPDASPAKWHLAHTTWFFETFLLRDFADGYAPYDERYGYLFNSYYEAEGARHARPERGLLTRPAKDDILAYRAHVDAAITDAIGAFDDDALALVELGLHHEQQHQELLLTDILHLFSKNPIGPALRSTEPYRLVEPEPLEWTAGAEGIARIGHDGDGFAFDCEGPRHDVVLAPHRMASRPVTNREWRDFIADGGYANAALWLSDGWAWVGENGIDAPLYWRMRDGAAQQFSLHGWQNIDDNAPVRHVSFYEADAFATWAERRWPGARLPTEAEWETAAEQGLPNSGDVWEWTGSAYRPHPGFRAAPGAVGEYNGKFMAGQFVLKGGSSATSPDHVRPSYRNFFYPHQRWQYSGLRLARDI